MKSQPPSAFIFSRSLSVSGFCISPKHQERCIEPNNPRTCRFALATIFLSTNDKKLFEYETLILCLFIVQLMCAMKMYIHATLVGHMRPKQDKWNQHHSVPWRVWIIIRHVYQLVKYSSFVCNLNNLSAIAWSFANVCFLLESNRIDWQAILTSCLFTSLIKKKKIQQSPVKIRQNINTVLTLHIPSVIHTARNGSKVCSCSFHVKYHVNMCLCSGIQFSIFVYIVWL